MSLNSFFSPRLKKIISPLFRILTVVVTLCFICGLWIILDFALSSKQPVAEKKHTRYDQELGWVHQPNVFIHDMYGKDIDLKINSQGFRSDYNFSKKIPQGKIRFICSGDSFTMGYGVNNQDTWVQRLGAFDLRFEMINMGQGGYGIDQSYLLYKREEKKFLHNIHLFAFIYEDFLRMGSDQFLGIYGKPVLEWNEGKIHVTDIPVPPRALLAPWLAENLERIRSLPSVRMLIWLFQPFSGRGGEHRNSYDTEALRNLALAVFSELHSEAVRDGRVFVLVYLPTRADFNEDSPSALDRQRFRKDFAVTLGQQGITFVDLTDDFGKLGRGHLRRLFLDSGRYPRSAGHYSVEGNSFVARFIYEEFLRTPQISRILQP